MPQFNGKQEGKFTLDRPNLRCPRNGKQTEILGTLRFHPSATGRSASGKVMKVALPARIPANEVVVRPQGSSTVMSMHRRGRR
jgi:hypothetical protein